MLAADKVALHSVPVARHLDGALAFDVAHNAEDAELRWNLDQYVNMVGHQVPFVDDASLLFGQFTQNWPKLDTQWAVELLSRYFGIKKVVGDILLQSVLDYRSGHDVVPIVSALAS